MDRVKDIYAQRTDLTIHYVYLDNSTIMNASSANKYFSEKSISKIIAHVAKAGISFKLLCHKFMYYCNILKEGKVDNTPFEI